MKFLIVATLLAVANAGIIPIAGQIETEVIPGVANEHIVQGPSTKTRVLGPDGAQINADAPGGRILPDQSIIALTPVIELAQPLVAVAHPSVTLTKTIVQTNLSPVQEILEPQPIVISGPVVAKVEGDDSAGEYVPDNTENLYDDGSYKESPVEASDDGTYKGE